jgi:threonine aldolase
MSKWIDLKSDTVTKPTPSMLKAMMQAEVGDSLYFEDPTVIELERYLADQVQMDAAMFVCSGTQSNLLGIMSHCERGDEYISGQEAHVYKWEGGGAAVLGSVQPQPIDFETDGSLKLELVKKYIKPDDFHHARTKLLCLENTQAGKVLPLSYLQSARTFSQENNLKLHLDGARAYNAAVKQGVAISEISKHFDSISICLSKGLGAPVGSVLCGSKDLIKKAIRWRKVVGGGMRQAGILAGAGLYALQHHVNRLAEDHENALVLARELANVEGLSVDVNEVQTNMVFVNVLNADPRYVSQELKKQGIVVPPAPTMRLVTHLDVSTQDVHRVVAAFKEVLRSPGLNTMVSSSSMDQMPLYQR